MSEPRAEDADLRAAGERAIEELERGIPKEPAELKDEVRRATAEMVRLRDGLIERVRAEPERPRTQGLRLALDRVNAAISLALAVEYPIGPIQRRRLELARDALRTALEGGAL